MTDKFKLMFKLNPHMRCKNCGNFIIYHEVTRWCKHYSYFTEIENKIDFNPNVVDIETNVYTFVSISTTITSVPLYSLRTVCEKWVNPFKWIK